MLMKANQRILDAVANLTLPKDRTFGKAVLPIVCTARYENGAWSELELKFDADVQVSSGSPAVQYAQSIFEGMKAYWMDQEEPQIFRPHHHAARFKMSAERLCMPPVPEEMFVAAVKMITCLYKDIIPREVNSALYLRPSLYGDDYSLSIEPSDSYRFTVHAAPTIPFSLEMMSVLIERQHIRASLGGTGNVKAAGNYAAGFASLKRARALNCATSLWLDPLEGRFIEELSLMNFFIFMEGGLYTPMMQDSFLSGITRQSLIMLAYELGIRTVEKKIDINGLIARLLKGDNIEAFSTGTAAVVSPIRSLKEADGTEYVFGETPGSITQTLRKQLLDVQEGRAKDKFGWMETV
ncbi:branched-chain amino acid aminotransferase [Paremcibacter congregatus]|uniref:Branched-chain-amino-acid aminotransferase n=1 Tax=Paremcibacter congregatus TaxID=2043170 RepID=A0A2G4YWN5_9PROT|nr:branched-chain amino acid aminotransferase [Paremcibacter congregatus]PHZ86748.1 branched chain amino acid aminotransferase [Paremcibacter congregatus]QDE26252.1 branched-chain amino acid aminotransferase [Paremcibacter congregatus]